MTDQPDPPVTPDQGYAPAPPPPPPGGVADPTHQDGDGGWPTSAKVTAAVLAILLVATGATAVAGWINASDDSDVDEAEAELTAAGDELDARTEEYESTIAELTRERDEAITQADDVQEQLDTAVAERDDLQVEVNEQAAETASLIEQQDELEAQIAELQGQLDAVYPIDASTSLEGIPEDDLVGDYTIDFNEAYCEGLASCGSAPSPLPASIAQGPNGLVMTVPDMWEGGLFRTEGALYGIADSETVVQPCGETPRLARVTMTVWADEAVVAEDGARSVDDLQASITVNALPIDDCPHGLVFYGSNLTQS